MLQQVPVLQQQLVDARLSLQAGGGLGRHLILQQLHLWRSVCDISVILKKSIKKSTEMLGCLFFLWQCNELVKQICVCASITEVVLPPSGHQTDNMVMMLTQVVGALL